MKVLYTMDDLDKGKLLFALFPEELENIQKAIKKECEMYLKYEIALRKAWNVKGFLTADFWFRLVYSTYDNMNRNKGKLWQKPKSFADYLFDGNDAIFTKDCLIEYASSKECDFFLKKAIDLFFGSDKTITYYILNSDNSLMPTLPR
ncbi:hypothetical protein SF1_18400 [Sphingobacterium faecium NBRC 15299]|uniref:hypothetical protein n=1 Tax=Sphingobacterium faecium TaxID=34087 RepID=UPI000D47DB2E|nr:hypothetical protein [Sphingobacterium faecium]PTX09521.1 hypothetical protein C8N37_106149 [Sphingobacterium faecium]GEM63858.1 hypothetical protein SF1_18400 [Sphingobacterium faecium NBRC 15299]